MKRGICLLLCLCMLLMALTSCQKETPENPISTPKEENTAEETNVTLKRYAVVYPKQTSKVVRDAAVLLAETIGEVISAEVEAVTDEERPAKMDEKKEILIGQTNRTASKEYYEKTPTLRYDVYRSGAKIVLAGYTDTLTAKAVSYFIENYVNKAKNGVTEPVVEYSGELGDVMTLSEGGASAFCLSFLPSDLQTYSYFEDVLATAETTLASRLGFALPRLELDATYDPDRAEIVLGRTSYEELAEDYEEIPLGGYLISVHENKILIAATAKSGYTDALLALDKLLSANMLYGTTDIFLPIGEKQIAVSSAMFENLPAPEKMPNEMLAAGDHASVAIFRNVTEDFFASYAAKLVEAGFALYTETTFNGSVETQKNLFATYVSDKATVDLGFHAYAKRMYCSVSPKGALTLPDREPDAYTALDSIRYPTMLTQVGTYEFHRTEAAMCYVLRLADGSFILYDTSYGQYGDTRVAEEIYAVLRKQAPDPNNIVISAIFLTHPHTDHVGGFVQFASLYGTNPTVKVEQVVYNFPDTMLARVNGDEINAVANATAKFGAKTELVKPRTGNVLYYADVKFNILYTQEDYLALQPYFTDGNTMTMVTQMETAGGCKVVFGGDHPAADTVYDGTPFCESALARWYGDFLQSYVVTMFHHGLGGGADYLIYPAVAPKIVLWPGTWFRINGQDNGKPYTYASGETYKLYEHGYNQYFSVGLEPDVWHETPNANGVHGWFVADDGIQTLTFVGERAVVSTYATRDIYLGRSAS